MIGRRTRSLLPLDERQRINDELQRFPAHEIPFLGSSHRSLGEGLQHLDREISSKR